MPEEKRGASEAVSSAPVSPPLKRFRPVKIAIVIVAVLLIVGGPAGFFLYEQRAFDNAFAAVTNQVQLCLDAAAKNAVLHVGVQGGMATITPIAYAQPQYQANYLYYAGASRVPSPNEFSDALAEYVQENVRGCIEDISSNDVSVAAEGAVASVQLDGGVVVTLEGGLVVQSRLLGRSTQALTSVVPVDAADILVPVQAIVDHVSANRGIASLSALEHEGFGVTYQIEESDNVVVFLVRDLERTVDGTNYAWLFAVDVA